MDIETLTTTKQKKKPKYIAPIQIAKDQDEGIIEHL